MLGTKTTIASFLLASVAFAQNYWPLTTGNIWVYKTTDRGYVRWTIQRTEDFDGKTYSLLAGDPAGDVWLRGDDEGRVYAFDPRTREEKLYYRFGAGVGESYETAIPDSGGRAQLQTRNESYRGPVGQFSNALAIAYPGAQRPPGFSRELFLPHVGMVHRDGIGGIQASSWDLVYASLGGVTIVTQPETSFAIAVERNSVRLTLRHIGANALEIDFPSGQTYEMAIYDTQGQRVYTWSADKLFVQAARTEKFLGERTWVEPMPTLAPGRYQVDCFLTTSAGPVYRATVPIVISGSR